MNRPKDCLNGGEQAKIPFVRSLLGVGLVLGLVLGCAQTAPPPAAIDPLSRITIGMTPYEVVEVAGVPSAATETSFIYSSQGRRVEIIFANGKVSEIRR